MVHPYLWRVSVFALYIVLSLCAPAHAKGGGPITHLSLEQGLSNNSVRCIYQDHRGFLWFGTYDGLNRYDGSEFSVFRNRLNDSLSLPHNYIYTIGGDQDGRLWVGTGQGAAMYNSCSETFTPVYYTVYGTSRKRRLSFAVNSIATDTAGDVLIGTNGEGLIVHRRGAKLASQLSIPSVGGERTAGNVQSIFVDPSGQTWVFILNVGLCRYDEHTSRIVLVSSVVRSVTCMAGDMAGHLWLGNPNGVFQYSIVSGAITNTYTAASGRLSSDNVTCLFMDSHQLLWIGTEGGGITLLHPVTGKSEFLLPGDRPDNLTSEAVYAIYEDKEARIWIATLKGGIDVIDPNKNDFQTVSHRAFDHNSLINNFVSTFLEDDDRNLWIGSDGGGISIWNRRSNTYIGLTHHPADPHSLSNDAVSCFRKDYLGNIWVATFGGGIDLYEKATGSFRHYRCINDSTGEENKNVWLVYEDRDKNLWASTFANGSLYRFDRVQQRFRVFDQQLFDLLALAEDKEGTLWAGDHNMLIKVDKATKNHTVYFIGKPVRSIYEDHAGNLWIGTEGGGLSLFDRKRGKVVEQFGDKNGLCNNSVLNILEGEGGELWLSTFNGLSRFDPKNKTFTNFFGKDGLQSNQFTFNAALRLEDGELAFGGIRGFNLFYPNSIRVRAFMPPVFITRILVNNQPVSAEAQLITREANGFPAALRIPYNQAVFSFAFAALEYSSPDKINYAYYLEGWDKPGTWIYAGPLRTTNYNNIAEGSYILHVRATNAAGVWNPAEAQLAIVVLPPWYRSWWAYSCYGLLVGSLLFAFLYFKGRQARLEYAIQVAKIHADKEKELTERKATFFTYVSHEFRTPLMLIINPLTEIFQRKRQFVPAAELNIVLRNSRRLLSLVDQLLLFNKTESGLDTLTVSRIDLRSLCQQVYDGFVHQAENKDINFTFTCSDGPICLYGDREKLEAILFNLLSNAFKYTPVKGSIGLTARDGDKEIYLGVSDTGKGIPASAGAALFEKFYRAEDEAAEKKAGFGIGLYMVKKFVDAHFGQIFYQSNQDAGSVFEVRFKKGWAHFPGVAPLEEGDQSPILLDELLGSQEMPETPLIGDGMPVIAALSEESAPPLPSPVTDKQSMLIIDDNDDMREYLSGIFSSQFLIYLAGNGVQGLQLAREVLPDIIISDIMMDGADGLELCKTIKDNPSLNYIPIILVTANPSSDIRLAGIKGGADDYISKPFDKELIASRVVSLLKNRNNLQKYFYNELTLKRNHLKISEEDRNFIDRCIKIVEARLDEDDFSIAKLSTLIGMSHSNLYKKVKAVSGLTPTGFIRFIRLRKAAEMLIQTDHNISEVSLLVGINDARYFREQFNKLFGCNPSDFAKKFKPGFSRNLSIDPGIARKIDGDGDAR